jgi:RimJ/RimL family protein N-acetyltransferase
VTQGPAVQPEAWQGEAFAAALQAVLHTPRLDLEPLNEAHADELWLPLADPRLYDHVPQDPPTSLTALRERFAMLSARRSPPGDQLWLNWVMRDRSDGQCRGRLQATVTTEALAWIAYDVFPPNWGAGFATEGCHRMIEWLIDELGVQQVAAEVDSLNDASLRLLDRLGFQRTSWRAAADQFKGRVSNEWTLRLDAAAFARAKPAQTANGGASAGAQ